MGVYEVGKEEPTIYCHCCEQDKRESAGYFVFGETYENREVICADCILEYIYNTYSENMSAKMFRNAILEDLKSWK